MSLIDGTHGTRIPQIQIHRGMRLAAARQSAGITQEQIAALLRVNRRTIGRWEGDDTSAPPAVIIAYSLATDVNLGWLQSGVADQLTTDFDSFTNKAPASREDAGADVARLEGLEPPTFCSVAWEARFWAIVDGLESTDSGSLAPVTVLYGAALYDDRKPAA